MPYIPPSAPPASAPPPGNDEVSDLQNYFQTLSQDPQGGKAAFGKLVYQAIQQFTTPKQIEDFLSGYLVNSNLQDIYLNYAVQGFGFAPGQSLPTPLRWAELTEIQGDVQQICQKYSDSWSMPVPTQSGIDSVYLYIQEAIYGGQVGDASLKSLFNQICGEISTLGSNDRQGVQDFLTQTFTTSIFTTYPNLSHGDIQTIYDVMAPWNEQYPDHQLPDYLHSYLLLGYIELNSLPAGSAIYKLASDLLQEMQKPDAWSGGSSVLKKWLITTASDPNFLNNYPGIKWSDVTTVGAFFSFPVSADISQYAQALAWANSLSSSDPNYGFAKDLVSEMYTALYNLQPDFTGVAQTMLSTIFTKYPTITPAALDHLVQFTGIPPLDGTLEGALFTMLQQMAQYAPNSPEYNMYLDFGTKWTNAASVWPEGGISTFWSWYNQQPDVFVLYLNVFESDPSAIVNMLNCFSPSSPPTPSAFDEKILGWWKIQSTYSVNSEGYNFFALVIQKALQIGSADPNYAFENWVDGLALSSFSGYTDTRLTDLTQFMSTLPFSFTLNGQTTPLYADFIIGYISIWEKEYSEIPDVAKFGNTIINLISTAEAEGQAGSLANLQAFLNQNKIDYMKTWPGLEPLLVYDFYNNFGLTPSPITAFDFGSALATALLQKVPPGSIDAAWITHLESEIMKVWNDPSHPSFSTIASWLQTQISIDPTGWNSVSVATRDAMEGIVKLPPPIS